MKIVIATGGSGGHIFPALEVAEKLKQEGHEIYFLGVFGDFKKKIESRGFPFQELTAKGFSPDNLLGAISGMVQSTIVSFRFLGEWKPDIVAGFGGYGSFPGVFAAVLKRYPTLIHEQNVVPGKANKLLSRIVNKVTISFQNTEKYLNSSKTVLTGYPCRFASRSADKSTLAQKFGLDPKKNTLLVLGGSQGSHRINTIFLKTIKLLKEKIDFQVIHVSGKYDYEDLKEKYEQENIPFRLYDFLDNIEEAYGLADLVIARAGAGTVYEIALHRLPCVLIPYPHAQGHQTENARVLEEIELARVMEEERLNDYNLSDNIAFLLKRQQDREEMDRKLNQICFPDAGERLVEEIGNLVQCK